MSIKLFSNLKVSNGVKGVLFEIVKKTLKDLFQTQSRMQFDWKKTREVEIGFVSILPPCCRFVDL